MKDNKEKLKEEIKKKNEELHNLRAPDDVLDKQPSSLPLEPKVSTLACTHSIYVLYMHTYICTLVVKHTCSGHFNCCTL